MATTTTTRTTYIEQGPIQYPDAGVPVDGVNQGYKGGDDVSELRRRVQYLEERMTRSEPNGNLSSKSLAEAVGTTPSSHASVVANPAPLGLFAFGLTTAMLSVSAEFHGLTAHSHSSTFSPCQRDTASL